MSEQWVLTKFNFNRQEGFRWICAFELSSGNRVLSFKASGSKRKVVKWVRGITRSYGMVSPV